MDFHKRAEEAFNKGDFQKAESLLAEALARDPSLTRAHQLLARVYIRSGELDKANDIFKRKDEIPKDENFWMWGKIAEELERPNEAAKIYSEYLKLNPQHPDSLYNLGMLFLERGNRNSARNCFLRATKAKPDFTEATLELAKLYEEDGLLGLAAALYDKILSIDPRNTEAETARGFLRDKLSQLESMPGVKLAPSKTSARRLAELFRGREGVYARQWIDAEGKMGYSPVYEPLTEKVLERHLLGDITVGVYPVRVDNTVMFMAIDVDVNKKILSRASEKPEIMKLLQDKVKENVRKLTGMFEYLFLPAYVESSGYKGCHIWLFFAEPVPAHVVRKFAQAVTKRTGPPSPELHWEIFPKQDSLEEGQLGNLIKLPLGIHKKTGRRALFVDPEGKVYADQIEFLNLIKRIDRTSLQNAIKRLLDINVEKAAPPGPEILKEKYHDLRGIWEKCAVVNALVEKSFATHHLTNSERVVLKCIFAHLGDRGVGFLHSVIGNCLDYSYEATQYQIERTHKNPISCPKIRQHLPEITSSVNCSCEFELPEDGYPSPILHIDPDFTRGMSKFRFSEAEALANRYVKLKGEIRRVSKELREVEEEISSLFRIKDTSTITTDNWILTRAEDGVRVELRGEP